MENYLNEGGGIEGERERGREGGGSEGGREGGRDCWPGGTSEGRDRALILLGGLPSC